MIQHVDKLTILWTLHDSKEEWIHCQGRQLYSDMVLPPFVCRVYFKLKEVTPSKQILSLFCRVFFRKDLVNRIATLVSLSKMAENLPGIAIPLKLVLYSLYPLCIAIGGDRIVEPDCHENICTVSIMEFCSMLWYVHK